MSLTSSITAAIGVFRTKRRPMSSVTLAIVWCVFRASAVGSTSSTAGRSAAVSVTRHSLCRNRTTPSIPSSCHSASWSTGPRNGGHNRVASAP
jgi:hypothetical protein